MEADTSLLYSTQAIHSNLDLAMQAGHFGQAVFDPAGLTDDYKRQAEVSIQKLLQTC